ncbi:MAG: hypothetical protein FGF53_08000 [Candidatus Brockarchaeota archaeon]|mgnify:FL=1|nr:hypothetical protein [Candidatus Brockarchaeota archaeon]
MEEVQRLEKILREKGLTEEQVKAGVKYYLNFCKRHNLNLAKSVRMIVQMVKGMREYYEKTG